MEDPVCIAAVCRNGLDFWISNEPLTTHSHSHFATLLVLPQWRVKPAVGVIVKRNPPQVLRRSIQRRRRGNYWSCSLIGLLLFPPFFAQSRKSKEKREKSHFCIVSSWRRNPKLSITPTRGQTYSPVGNLSCCEISPPPHFCFLYAVKFSVQCLLKIVVVAVGEKVQNKDMVWVIS